jgi:hypothetical protein
MLKTPSAEPSFAGVTTSKTSSVTPASCYYPVADRNSAGVIFENAAVGIGVEAVGNLFQEFVARRFSRNKR